jgi:hypothetical protein
MGIGGAKKEYFRKWKYVRFIDQKLVQVHKTSDDCCRVEHMILCVSTYHEKVFLPIPFSFAAQTFPKTQQGALIQLMAYWGSLCSPKDVKLSKW